MPVKHHAAVAALISLGGFLACAAAVAGDASEKDMAAAVEAIAPVIRATKQTCPDEDISAKPSNAAVAQGLTAVLVTLSTTGDCLGREGQYSYLLVKQANDWRRVLSVEPGSIEIGPADQSGVAPITLAGAGACEIRYNWRNKSYQPKLSEGCGAETKPRSLSQLATMIRAGAN